jgi:hypothetical protein
VRADASAEKEAVTFPDKAVTAAFIADVRADASAEKEAVTFPDKAVTAVDIADVRADASAEKEAVTFPDKAVTAVDIAVFLLVISSARPDVNVAMFAPYVLSTATNALSADCQSVLSDAKDAVILCESEVTAASVVNTALSGGLTTLVKRPLTLT